jgi:glycosyltransferase involved in cell wall biosynthesis
MIVKAVVTSLDNLNNLRESLPVLRSEPVDEIVIVNNGSSDGTEEWLSTQEDITVINRANRGAGPGRNAGLDKAGTFDYVLMLDGGIRPLRGGTEKLLDYMERHPDYDVVGVEIPDFETDYKKAWRRWPDSITDSYQNRRLSHTAYCLARWRAFDGLRFCEEGPFGEPGWGADDDEMAYRWNEAGINIQVITGVHPYRRASGSFRRLYQETGIWPNQYGSVYEKRLVWLQHNWPQYEPGMQWGEPWLTVVVEAEDVDKTAKMVRYTHNRLRKRKFDPPWDFWFNPYSIVVWVKSEKVLGWTSARHLRQHHGDTIILDEYGPGRQIIKRSEENESTWTGDFIVSTSVDWRSMIRQKSHYFTLVDCLDGAVKKLDKYDELHPHQPIKNPPRNRGEL